jgi:hypothetical protein
MSTLNEIKRFIREESIPRLYIFECLESVYWFDLKRLEFYRNQSEKRLEYFVELVFEYLLHRASINKYEEKKFKMLIKILNN